MKFSHSFVSFFLFLKFSNFLNSMLLHRASVRRVDALIRGLKKNVILRDIDVHEFDRKIR